MSLEFVTSPLRSPEPPELRVQDLTKRFGSVLALDRVSLCLKPGTFHALLGENGAGKSTLVKCVIGMHRPTSGQIFLNGQACAIANPRVAQQHHLGMVYQHFTLIPAMTVAENLVLARRDRAIRIRWHRELARLQDFLAIAPFQLPLHAPVESLSAGEKQKLEILKLLYLKSRLLILDEPTSVLTPTEAAEVLGLLRAQVTAGQLSVLLISHKFRDVMPFADEVTVLRQGRVVGGGRCADLTVAELSRLMIGDRQLAPTTTIDRTAANGKPVLTLQQLQAQRDNGLPALANVTLTVHQGEIVGVAGVAGNGQRELVEVLAGQRSPTGGSLQVNGTPYHATRPEMRRHGVFVLPEEPLRNACVPHMSVAENLALHTFDRPPQARWGWWLRFRAIEAAAQRLIQQFQIQTPSPRTPIQTLSGGNVQRTVLARELAAPDIQLLIAANPCMGLDFAAVADIHAHLLAARQRGVAVLLVSEDLDELLQLADRLLVLSGGQVVYERAIAEVDLDTVSRRMAGH